MVSCLSESPLAASQRIFKFELFSVVILTRVTAIESALGGPTLGSGYSPLLPLPLIGSAIGCQQRHVHALHWYKE